jgi:hypothetical protein
MLVARKTIWLNLTSLSKLLGRNWLHDNTNHPKTACAKKEPKFFISAFAKTGAGTFETFNIWLRTAEDSQEWLPLNFGN